MPGTRLRIAPSIIAADQARLAEEINAVERAGADKIHVDVMDGHFVPNITLGPGVVADIRKATRLPLDCHLMVAEPWKWVKHFCRAGADQLSVHVETTDPGRTLSMIRGEGVVAGLAINPKTPVEVLEGHLQLLDFVVVMTVHPGFSGQRMIVESLDKVKVLRDIASARDLGFFVQVDGGVDSTNVSLVAGAGAREAVAGSAVFGTDDYGAAIGALRAVQGPGS